MSNILINIGTPNEKQIVTCGHIIKGACATCIKNGFDEALSANNEKWEEKIKELKSINESHRKLNGELRERIKELEEELEDWKATAKANESTTLMKIALEGELLTKDDIRLIKTALENESMRRYGNVKKDAPIFIRLAKLQKIIGGKNNV